MNAAREQPVAIVTGGSRGIGRSIVERLHRGGYAVLFTHSASEAEAQALRQSLDRDGHACRPLRIDIARADAAALIFDAADTLGGATVLVNNAGITGAIGPIQALEDATLERLVAVNLLAPVRLCREAARRWTDGAPRSIVNIGSIAARTGSPGEYVAYAATKAALETFTRGLARELAPAGIRVNAVSPGTVDTTIHARAGEPDRAARVARRVPLGRPGQPGEIAAAVAWLLSGEASYATGSVLEVTGGL
ncbi:SDR family NAD(P)-dependent oxidoreductase [Luteimonas sp. SDU101]|uniref:SDR family NAD(P)-dependent oxidoreductase n=1 Tax=Luteimonas sp. SDU101 TaxID=3422593 RepID=UPI003EBC843E